MYRDFVTFQGYNKGILNELKGQHNLVDFLGGIIYERIQRSKSTKQSK